jgi:hypothetical protein
MASPFYTAEQQRSRTTLGIGDVRAECCLALRHCGMA